MNDNFAQYKQEGPDFLRERMSFHNKRDYRVETAVGLLESWGLVDEGVETKELENLLDGDWRAARKKRQQEKLLKIVNFVKDENCRQLYIYEYFGEADTEPCGVCDLCRQRAAR
jgi:ATP-dependent DNA helicase RecQ